MAGDSGPIRWHFDGLYLLAIVLYAALALAFACHFITTYAQPPARHGSERAPVLIG